MIEKHITQKDKTANVSGWLRENQIFEIDSENIKRLSQIPTPNIAEKTTKYIKYLSKKYPLIGQRIKIKMGLLANIENKIINNTLLEKDLKDAKKYLPHLSISWACNVSEFMYILDEYLSNYKHFLKFYSSSLDYVFSITPPGWEFIENLKRKNIDSQTAFIAMWFDKSLDSLLSHIENAVYNAGYKPNRIDKKEHVNRIDDEIISDIKESKFIIADFTNQRGGVYFESGYALGFGLPVIWLCREDDLKKYTLITGSIILSLGKKMI